MTGFEGRVLISHSPEWCDNRHVAKPSINPKLPWPPKTPFIIELDFTIATYLQNKEQVCMYLPTYLLTYLLTYLFTYSVYVYLLNLIFLRATCRLTEDVKC